MRKNIFMTLLDKVENEAMNCPFDRIEKAKYRLQGYLRCAFDCRKITEGDYLNLSRAMREFVELRIKRGN